MWEGDKCIEGHEEMMMKEEETKEIIPVLF
jgi:hypothetical protein